LSGSSEHRTSLETAVSNTGFGVAGEIVDLIFRTIGSILLARLLGPVGLGSWLVARTVAFDLGQIPARIGLDEATLRYVSMYSGQGRWEAVRGILKRGLSLSFVTSLATCLALIAAAPVLAKCVFKKPETEWLIRSMAPSVLLLAPGYVLLSAIQGINLLKYRVLAQKVALPVLQAAVLGAGLFASLSFGGAICAHYAGIVALVFLAIFVGYPVFRRVVGHISGSFSIRTLISFAWPVSLAEASNYIVLWAGVLMLGILSTREQTGIFGVALRVGSLVWIPLHAVNQMFAPMIAAFFGRKQSNELEIMFKTTARWTLFASLPICIIVIFAGREILALFGPEFLIGFTSLAVVAAGKMVAAGTGSVGFMLNMTGHQRLNLLNSVVLGVLNIGLSYLWIERYGSLGAAAASSVSLALVNIARVVQVRIILGYSLLSRGYYVGAASAIFLGIILALVRPVISGVVPTFIVSCLFLAMYGILIWVFALDETDREAARIVRTKVGSA